MTTYRHKRLSIEPIERGAESFALRDERGRAIGIRFTIHEIKARAFEAGDGCAYYLVPFDATTYYDTVVQPTRNGMSFGASQRGTYALTLEDARREVTRRTKATLKRYTKKYG